MALKPSDAYDRLRKTAQQVDPALDVDRGSIHWIDGPYPGVSFTLVLGGARALLFMPAADIAPPGSDGRLRQRLEASRQYLAGFTPSAR